jgi:hypothetical protein
MKHMLDLQKMSCAAWLAAPDVGTNAKARASVLARARGYLFASGLEN